MTIIITYFIEIKSVDVGVIIGGVVAAVTITITVIIAIATIATVIKRGKQGRMIQE